VTATNALQQLAAGGGLEVLRTARWHPTSLTWVPVLQEDTLTAGTVLWVQATVGGTVTVTGVPGVARELNLPAGGSFVGGWGFQPLDVPTVLPPGADLWLPGGEGVGWRVLPALDRTWAMLGNRPRALGPHQAMFLRVSEPSQLGASGGEAEVEYYHLDHLGNLRVITDNTGLSAGEKYYYTYGALRLFVSDSLLRHSYLFTGAHKDEETGLNEFLLRYQSPVIGRFVSVDRLRSENPKTALESPQSHNTYSYCVNRPTVLIDVIGNEETKSMIAFCFNSGAGGTIGAGRGKDVVGASFSSTSSLCSTLDGNAYYVSTVNLPESDRSGFGARVEAALSVSIEFKPPQPAKDQSQSTTTFGFLSFSYSNQNGQSTLTGFSAFLFGVNWDDKGALQSISIGPSVDSGLGVAMGRVKSTTTVIPIGAIGERKTDTIHSSNPSGN
jgi:RHS repeat-associated protein